MTGKMDDNKKIFFQGKIRENFQENFAKNFFRKNHKKFFRKPPIPKILIFQPMTPWDEVAHENLEIYESLIWQDRGHLKTG